MFPEECNSVFVFHTVVLLCFDWMYCFSYPSYGQFIPDTPLPYLNRFDVQTDNNLSDLSRAHESCSVLKGKSLYSSCSQYCSVHSNVHSLYVFWLKAGFPMERLLQTFQGCPNNVSSATCHFDSFASNASVEIYMKVSIFVLYLLLSWVWDSHCCWWLRKHQREWCSFCCGVHHSIIHIH